MPAGAVVRHYQATYGEIKDSTIRRIEAAWNRLGGPTDADQDRFRKAALPIVQGAEVAVVRLVSAYMNLLAQNGAGPGPTSALDAVTVTGSSLRGVDPAVVYGRPTVVLRVALAEGKSYDESFRLAASRASTLVRTDLALAQRAATNAIVARDDRIIGYSRVLSGTCSFCAKVAPKINTPDDDLALHANCDCSVAPVLKPKEHLRHEDNTSATEWAHGHWSDTPLTDAERDALKRYGEGAYSGINRQLRSKQIKSETQETISLIDKALKRKVVPEDVVVWRRMNLGDAVPGKLPDELVGQTLTERGFMSTSVGKGPAGGGSGLSQTGDILEIRVPAGTPGYFVREIAAPRYKGERELLLGRDQKYVVREAKYSRGRWRVVVEIVP